MSWCDLFKEESLPEVEAAFNIRELVSLADKALEEEPDNKSIKAYRSKKVKELAEYYRLKEEAWENRLYRQQLDRDFDYYFKHGRLRCGS